MTLLKHTYSTPVERALENLRENDYESEPLALEGLYSTSVRFASRAARLYIPEGHPLGYLATDVLGDEFLLGVIENASYLRRWTGTELAIKRVAEIAGVGYTYSISGENVTFSVRPLQGSGAFSAAQLNFLTQIFNTVTPFYLTANIADIVDRFDAPPLYADAMIRLTDIAT